MTSKRSWALAALLGLIAILIGGALLLAGRSDEAPTNPLYQPSLYSGDQLLNLTETLSSDALQGRRVGTEGNAAARAFILKKYETLGLSMLGDTYEYPFTVLPDERNGLDGPTQAVNLVALVAGKTSGEGPAMVITAHYDHLGVRDGEIHNGADDNASGVAALIAVAEFFTENPPEHDVILVAFDAEEEGLLGARDFVRIPPISRSRIALNINFDMVSRSESDELFAVGTYHYPALKDLIVAPLAADAKVTLLTGHDSPDYTGADNWTCASDHCPFHEAGIPFLYFGVADHGGYHNPTDDYREITHDFFLRSVETLIMGADRADDILPQIAETQ